MAQFIVTTHFEKRVREREKSRQRKPISGTALTAETFN